MKCEFCGGNLSLEHKFCTHCGAVNKHAQQHFKDMQRFKGDFEETRENVYEVTGKYKGIVVRAALIAMLLIMVIVCIIIYSDAYSIKLKFHEYQANWNYDSYSRVINQYMEEENYQALSAFCTAKDISGYERKYKKYNPVIRTSRDYCTVYDYLMGITVVEDEETRESMLESLSWSLESFYDGMNREHYEYYEGADSEENIAALERMENNIAILLQTYLEFTQEESAQFKGMSQAKRIVIIEEKLRDGQ